MAFDIGVREVPATLSDDMRDFWGGYRIEFKIMERERYNRLRDDIDTLGRNAPSIGKRGSTKFCVDISKHEYCRPKQSRQLEGYTIYVYSPEMMVSEKLRAIRQQMPEYVELVKNHPSARARDFIDIHTLTDRLAIDFHDRQFQGLIRDTFAAKRVPLSLIGNIKDFRDFHRQDFLSVQDTVKPGVQLEDFDYYFDYVVARCDSLEPLWNE